MFCPICETEYIAGVTVCEECGATLVAELPTAPPPEYVAYEEILSTLNPGEIAMIKSLLEEAGIDYRFLTEVAGPPLAMPARLLVPKDRVVEAKEMLDDFIAGGLAAVEGEDEGTDEGEDD